jgi:capsular exopolysaccharide synthesis family protein
MERGIGFLHGVKIPLDGARVGSEPGLMEYWRLIRKRRNVALLVGLSVLLLGAAVLLLIPWNYESTAQLELNFASISPLDALGLPSGAADLLGSNTDNEIGTEINALQAEPLMTKTINDLGLFLNPDFVGSRRARQNKESTLPWYARPKEREKELTKFGKLLDVEAQPKSFNVNVSFSFPDAQISQAVVKNLVAHYIESRFQTRYDTVMQTTHWLTDQLTGFKRTVDASQDKLAVFMRDHKIIETSSQPSAMSSSGVPTTSTGTSTIEVQNLVDLNHQLVQAQSARVVAEAKYRLSQSQDPDAMSSIFQDEILTAAKAQLATLQVQLAEGRSRLGSRHPHVIELENQIQEAEKQVNRRLDQLRTGFRNDYESAVKNENLLQQQVDQFTKQTTGHVDDYLEYEILKSELESNMALYQGLTQKLQEAGIAASLQATHINIVNPPQVPYKLHSPKFVFVIPALVLFSLIAAVAAAFITDRVDDSLTLPSQVEASIQIPVIGVIPHYTPLAIEAYSSNGTGELQSKPVAYDASIVTSMPNSPAAEAYRALRSSLLLSSTVAPKVFVLTSAVPGEGKSTNSINLASVMARQGNRVLLIDGDLRNPVLHKRFGISGKIGFSSVLTGASPSLSDAIVPIGATGSLELLPAGPRPPIPGDLLETDTARDLIKHFRNQFDYIIIDSPPVLAVNDGLILGRYADVVMLVVRARKTPKSALQYAVKRTVDEKLPVKGVIVTDLNHEAPEYQYSAYAYTYNSKYYNS